MDETVRSSPRSERWRVIVVASITLAASAPGQSSVISVFVDPMMATLGMTRSTISLLYLIGTLLGATALPTIGRHIDRRGTRRVTLLVGLGFAGVLGLLAISTGPVTLAVGLAGIRMLGQGALPLLATTFVAVRLGRDVGPTMGLVVAAGTATISLAPFALASAIGPLGWRAGWAIAAAISLVVVPLLAGLGMRTRTTGTAVAATPPTRTIGIVGPSSTLPAMPPQESSADLAEQADWTRARVLRSPFFWLLNAAVGLKVATATGITFHRVAVLGERGITPIEAAATFVPQAVAIIVAMLLFGRLVDTLSAHAAVTIILVTLSVSVVTTLTARSGWRAVLFGIAVGVALGALRVLEATVLPRIYGLAEIGAIRGVVSGVNVAASAVGPLGLSLLNDAAGGYTRPLIVLAIIPLLLALLTLRVRHPTGSSVVRPVSG